MLFIFCCIAAIFFYLFFITSIKLYHGSYSTVLLSFNLINAPVIQKKKKELLMHKTKLQLSITLVHAPFKNMPKKEESRT